MISDPRLDFFVFVNSGGILHLALRGYFVRNHFKLLDDEKNLKVLIRGILKARVAVPELEGPLLHVEDSGTQMAELEVAEVLAEIIDAFFSEHGFHVVESVTHGNVWYVLLHKQFHRPGVILREFLIEVGAGLKEERN